MDLVEFARRVEERLTNVNREPQWSAAEAEAYMTAVAACRDEFERISRHLIEAVIQPRVATIAGCFQNSGPVRRTSLTSISCWFGYCERFPVSTQLSLSIEHDVRFESVTIRYEAEVTPKLFRFNDRDALRLSRNSVSDEDVANWTEERLLEFIDVYLRIDRGSESLEIEAVNDPVCGMRISRTSAVATECVHGHPYFFCSQACRERFQLNPREFVDVGASGE